MSRINSRFKTILASILISCFVLNLFPLSLLALDEPYYSVSDEYEFSVTRVVSSRWEDHANIDFTITNNGNITINNWYITTDLPYEVENIWNASIAETSDNYITISSAPQNQPIEPGCSVTFGITGYSEDDSLFDVESSFYLLNIEDVVIPAEKYQVNTNVYSTTETGFSGAIAITNISSELLTIENVVLNSTNGLTINGNAAIEDETSLVVDSSSRNIYPNASIYINFEGTGEIPEVVELGYTGLAFTLTEDEDNDGILDIDEFLYPEEEPIVTPIPTITPTNTPEVEEPTETPTVTPEEEPTPSTTPEVEEPTPTPEEVTPTPTPEITEEYLFQDNDSDGLINVSEFILGCDVDSSDTDGDGILDIDEDYDQDGFTNGEEINLELNPVSNDTDFDLLLDYDEIYVYGTNPSLYDTDGDSVSDYDEIFLGKNPLANDIDVLISQEKSLELVSDELNGVNLATVNIDLADNISHQLQIRNVYNVDMYTSAIESLVGCPVDITCDEEFTEATITFTYVPELLDCSPEDLGILWYDEEHGFYIEQDSVLDVENNTISTTVNHFSTYALVNINEWWNAFDVPEASNGCFVVEYSTSYFVMGGLTNEDKIEAAYTVDEYEPRCFNMWANNAGNYRRDYELVARISGERTQVDSMRFVHDYIWIVRDVTDKDNDGLYDCYESGGMLLSNGTISFTSTTTDDLDDDGISDYEEAGILYEITRDANGKITIYVNGEVVLSGVYYIDESSQYYFLNDYVQASSVTTESPRSIWVPLSDPNNPDLDRDGCLDKYDARPMFTNPDIVYVFYGEDDSFSYILENEANYRERYCEERDIECVCVKTDTVSSFVEEWNGMGIDDSGITHNISEVFIISHGKETTYMDGETVAHKSYSILLSEGQEINEEILSTMNNKSIGAVYLMSCWGGTRYNDEYYSVADYFLYYFDVDYVYGCDGKTRIDYYFAESVVEFQIYDFLNHGYIPYSFNGGSWIIRAIPTEENSPGFYIYYCDNEGILQREALGELVWEI